MLWGSSPSRSRAKLCHTPASLTQPPTGAPAPGTTAGSPGTATPMLSHCPTGGCWPPHCPKHSSPQLASLEGLQELSGPGTRWGEAGHCRAPLISVPPRQPAPAGWEAPTSPGISPKKAVANDSLHHGLVKSLHWTGLPPALFPATCGQS